jgi:hypothetical protein
MNCKQDFPRHQLEARQPGSQGGMDVRIASVGGLPTDRLKRRTRTKPELVFFFFLRDTKQELVKPLRRAGLDSPSSPTRSTWAGTGPSSAAYLSQRSGRWEIIQLDHGSNLALFYVHVFFFLIWVAHLYLIINELRFLPKSFINAFFGRFCPPTKSHNTALCHYTDSVFFFFRGNRTSIDTNRLGSFPN